MNKDDTEMLAYIRSKLSEPVYVEFIHLWREHDQGPQAAVSEHGWPIQRAEPVPKSVPAPNVEQIRKRNRT